MDIQYAAFYFFHKSMLEFKVQSQGRVGCRLVDIVVTYCEIGLAVGGYDSISRGTNLDALGRSQAIQIIYFDALDDATHYI